MKNNVSEVIEKFLKELGITVNKKSIIIELEKHPNNNSLWAISDLLTNWNIPNLAHEVSIDDLIENPSLVPFITHLSSNQGEFVLVYAIQPDYIEVINNQNINHRLTIEEFAALYSGIILMAEATESSFNDESHQKFINRIIHSKSITILIQFLFLVSIVYILFHAINSLSIDTLSFSLLIFIKLMGLTASIMLLTYLINSSSPLLKKVCGKSKESCTKVLSSKAAKIGSLTSWSEIGFFYFTGTFFISLISIFNKSYLPFIVFFNVIGLPYTFFSIYYQWKIAKDWCVLCCSVQIILWLEFFVFLSFSEMPLVDLSLQKITVLFFCFLTPILFWLLIKPLLIKTKNFEEQTKQLHFFKYNEITFSSLMNSESIRNLLDDDCLFLTGNGSEKTVITLVSNPYCPACSVAHKKLNWAIARKDLRVQIVFALSGSGENVVQHLMTLSTQNDKQHVINALDDWYENKQKNYNEWKAKYPVTKSPVDPSILKKQSEWCEAVGIESTPTIFINGRKLPDSYSPEDIKYLV